MQANGRQGESGQASAPLAMPQACSALQRRVRRVLSEETGGPFQILRLEQPLEERPSAAGWLQQRYLLRAGGPCLLWSSRSGEEEVAALGAADTVAGEGLDGLDQLQKRLPSSGTNVRYYGGMRFDPGCEADVHWSAFGGVRFWLPRLELVRRGSAAALACNLVLPRDAQQADAVLSLLARSPQSPAPSPGALPQPVARTDAPDERGWAQRLRWTLDALEESALEKVVLARKTTFRFNDSVDALHLFHRLQEGTPGCFHFLFSPEGGEIFLGASPERLFRLEDGRLRSEAVAGTRPRGDSEAWDAALRDELLSSEKDRREHAHVLAFIRERLERYCTAVEADEEPSSMTLARGRHLYARLQGRARPGVTPQALLGALHPTPAVGGIPLVAARQAIRRQEPFDRGWYAGPVGWIGPEAAEFAVAIRSGLVRGKELDLFAGAGIVRGSDPVKEWEEIEQKISDFVSLFSADPQHAD